LKHINLLKIVIYANAIDSLVIRSVANTILDLDFFKAIIVLKKPCEELT